MDLAGRIAIVTGGAVGIGRAITERLRVEGATVVVADVDDSEPPFFCADLAVPVGNKESHGINLHVVIGPDL